MSDTVQQKIEVKQLSKSYLQGTSEICVLQSSDAVFESGKSYAITGVSGSGKSTLLYVLSGLEDPTRGSVLYNGQSITSFSVQEKNNFRNKVIGLLFQNPYLIAELSVLENIMLPGLIAESPEHTLKNRVQHLLSLVGLQGYESRKIGSLSGGQQTRVAIARALCNSPQFLLADEPTGNLDEETADQMVNVLIECQKTLGIGLIISTHDMQLANKLDHILVVAHHTLTQKK